MIKTYPQKLANSTPSSIDFQDGIYELREMPLYLGQICTTAETACTDARTIATTDSRLTDVEFLFVASMASFSVLCTASMLSLSLIEIPPLVPILSLIEKL